MSGIWAVVPVKPFAQAKQRLRPVLDAAAREALARAMLQDVLTALGAARALTRALAGIALVTRDAGAQTLARDFGAAVIPDSGGGLNAALAQAGAHLAARGAQGMLVLPGDVPAVTAPDIERLLAGHGKGIAIAPAHDRRGTNALLVTPPDGFALSFGPDSFTRHLAHARAAGLPSRIAMLNSLALDIDTPEDLMLFAATPSPTLSWRTMLEARIAGLPPLPKGLP